MKTINEMYNDLNKAVVAKLINEDYEIKERTANVVRLKVDGLPISFWVGSSANTFDCYTDFAENNFMEVKFTEEEKKILFNRLSLSEENRKKERIKELEAELKKLRS